MHPDIFRHRRYNRVEENNYRQYQNRNIFIRHIHKKTGIETGSKSREGICYHRPGKKDMSGRTKSVMEYTEEEHTAPPSKSETLSGHLFSAPRSHHQKSGTFTAGGFLQHGSFLRRNQSLLIIIDRQPQYTERHHRRQSKTQRHETKGHQHISLQAIHHDSFDPAPHWNHASPRSIQILMECTRQIITDFVSMIQQHASHANSCENEPTQAEAKQRMPVCRFIDQNLEQNGEYQKKAP